MNTRLKQIRKFQNMTMEEFGRLLGVTKTAISRLEKGERSLTEQMIKSVCREFNVNEEWLRSGSGEMFKQFPKEDERAALVSDLLEDVDNPVYALIEGIMKTYFQLDPKSQKVLKQFSSNLLCNLKKED